MLLRSNVLCVLLTLVLTRTYLRESPRRMHMEHESVDHDNMHIEKHLVSTYSHVYQAVATHHSGLACFACYFGINVSHIQLSFKLYNCTIFLLSYRQYRVVPGFLSGVDSRYRNIIPLHACVIVAELYPVNSIPSRLCWSSSR